MLNFRNTSFKFSEIDQFLVVVKVLCVHELLRVIQGILPPPKRFKVVGCIKIN